MPAPLFRWSITPGAQRGFSLGEGLEGRSTSRAGGEGATPARRGRWAGLIVAAAIIALAAGVLFVLQFSTRSIIGTDGYFHIKYSYLMSHGHGLIRRLPWLYYTIHRDYYRDHHFLQHLLYIPFTFGDLRLGAKVGAWLFGSAAMAVFYLTAARRGRAMAAILTVVLLGAHTIYVTRLMMPRVMSLAQCALLLVLWSLAAGRGRRLAALMFAYVWLYDGFAMGVFAIVAFFLAEGLAEHRWNWPLACWGLGGTAAGIVINPYFPRNLSSYLFNLLRTATAAQLIENTGWEWRPLSAWALLDDAKGVWILLLLGIVAAALCRKPRRDTIGLLLMALLASAMVMKARRHMDTWAPVSLLFTAHAWADIWDEARERRPGRRQTRRWLATALVGAVMAFSPFVIREQWEKTRRERDFAYYKGAAEFLLKHAEPRTVVFNADWDDFPYLFFFNSENYYVLGLDQLYMARYDPDLFQLWRDIVTGKEAAPSRLIRSKFNARYAVADAAGRERLEFMLRAEFDENMRKVYQDAYCVVYEVASFP